MHRIAILTSVFLSLLNVRGHADESILDKTVDNDNFVVTAPSRDLALAVLTRAELLRDEIAIQWLGEPLPPSVGPTSIYVTLSESEDRGWTSVGRDARRLAHVMWLSTSAKKATGHTLAHEMTHIVIGTQFPGRFPAWVNEGIASLRDDPDRLATRKRILHWYSRTGNWPSLEQLMSTEKVLATDQAAYATASSLVQFLLSMGDRSGLIEFAVDGRATGWKQALNRHYRIASPDELQRKWQSWVARSFASDGVATTGRQ